MKSEFKIIISISSDIASELALAWLKKGEEIVGTYRNWNENLEQLAVYKNLTLLKLDFADEENFNQLKQLVSGKGHWNTLVIASGKQEPIGKFQNVVFSDWVDGVKTNFLDQLKIVHLLLPFKSKKTENSPTVLFFAGGGTNNSVNNYSAYTISKIGLIKMCELLSTEIPSVKFSIVGPGWVKTKIHRPTIMDLGAASEDNYEKTIKMLEGNDCVPISEVVKSCDWVISQKFEVVTGRNFSTKSDKFDDSLASALVQDNDMYKLRRFKNNWS